MRESKRAHFEGKFSQHKSGGGNSRFRQGQGSSQALGQSFHKDRVPNPKAQSSGASGSTISNSPKCATGSGSGDNSQGHNRFYALQARQEVEESPNIVTSTLRVFEYNVYALLDPGANLSFVILYLTMRFDVSPEVLLEPYLVYTPIDKFVLAKSL